MNKVTLLSIMSPILTLMIHTILVGDFINKKGSVDNNPWVYNVPRAFNYIPVKTTDYLVAWTSSFVKPPHYTQSLRRQYKSIWADENYFTSIKRLPQHLGLGNYMVIVGQNPYIPACQLFVARMDSQINTGKFTKNISHNVPPCNDQIVASKIISTDYWNSGGIDLCGKYLAVALLKDTSSKIVFYDISQPDREATITKLKTEIVRPAADSQAVAITRLRDGHFLCAIWTHGKDGKHRGLDFYYSVCTKLSRGFDESFTLHIPETSIDNYKRHRDYKNINFVTDFTGKLYLVGTENESSQMTTPGIDHADLFEVCITTATQQMIDQAKKINPKKILAHLSPGKKMIYVALQEEKHMYCKQGKCNFNAGATLYIPDQQHIYLYAQPLWLTDTGKQIIFCQYAAIQKTYPQ